MFEFIVRPLKWMYFFMKVDPDMIVFIYKMTEKNQVDIMKLAEALRTVAEASAQTSNQVASIVNSKESISTSVPKRREDVFH